MATATATAKVASPAASGRPPTALCVEDALTAITWSYARGPGALNGSRPNLGDETSDAAGQMARRALFPAATAGSTERPEARPVLGSGKASAGLVPEGPRRQAP